MQPVDQVPVILQGEVGTMQGDDTKDSLMKTTAPQTCHVVTLYNKERRISVLTHIDDHTSVVATMDKISRILMAKFKIPLNNKFSAKLLGGIKKDAYCKNQKEAILNIFKELKLTFEQVELTEDFLKRPQIAINARNGELLILDGGQKNQRLEFLQKCEYGTWSKGYKINLMSPTATFDIREAERRESDIPETEYDEATVRMLLSNGMIPLPIKPHRTVAKELSQLVDEILDLIKKTNHAEMQALQTSVKNRNFNVLSRQASMDPLLLDLLKYLLDHRFTLGIDIHNSGKTSGTAYKVATNNKNVQAVEVLTAYYN